MVIRLIVIAMTSLRETINFKLRNGASELRTEFSRQVSAVIIKNSVLRGCSCEKFIGCQLAQVALGG